MINNTNPAVPSVEKPTRPLPARQQCTGCAACEKICPFGAISMRADAEGFLYPQIDPSLCRDCGLCAKQCPSLKAPKADSSHTQCYAVLAEDAVRLHSSSGGAFTLLARQVLAQKGVVYGAAFEKDWSVKHRAAETEEDLYPLCTSKYVQSNAAACFADVQKNLEQGRAVLFTGTPCQVAGLYAFLGKDYPQLMTADCVCHGVPNNEVWQKYLADNFDLKALSGLSFRDKKKLGWKASTLSVYFKDASHKLQSSYFDGFNQNLYLRPSCENCLYTHIHRQADFTLADFWGIDDVDLEANDRKGTSLLLVHTQKASRLVEQLRPQAKWIKEYPVSVLDHSPNYPLWRSSKFHPERASFFKEFRSVPFNTLVDKLLYKRFDVGIVGPYTVENYGSQIQYYSLYRAVLKEGYSALMIERPQNAIDKPNERPVLFSENPYGPKDLAPIFPSKRTMHQLNKNVRSFLVGSDQIFRYHLYKEFGKYVTLDWVEGDIPKSVYGLSFGIDTFPNKPFTKWKMTRDLKHFDMLSFREKSGQQLMQTKFGGLTGPVVLDPVFLMDQADFQTLIEKSKRNLPPKSLFCYILDKQDKKDAIVRQFAKAQKLNVQVLSDAARETSETRLCVEDWLKAFWQADFVITDSFHGMCFSIIFQKQFFVILNQMRGHTRFINLLKMLGLSSRILSSEEDLLRHQEPIDYKRVNKLLEKYRQDSWQVLRRMLALSKEERICKKSVGERVQGFFKCGRYAIKAFCYQGLSWVTKDKKKQKMLYQMKKYREKIKDYE